MEGSIVRMFYEGRGKDRRERGGGGREREGGGGGRESIEAVMQKNLTHIRPTLQLSFFSRSFIGLHRTITFTASPDILFSSRTGRN